MNGSRAGWCWARAAGAILIGSGTVAAAQEKSAPAPTPDAIGEARKEFEAIKSTREAALLPKSELPRVAVPELHGGPTPLPPTIITSKKSSLDPKAANWLLDAMEKQSARDKPLDRRSRDRPTKENARDAREVRDGERERTDRGERERTVDANEEQDPQRAAALNPLTRYLETWMTPQDHALLKPGLTESLTGMKDATAVSGAALSASVPGIADLGVVASKSIGAAIATTGPRDNPFLQTLKPELPPLPNSAKSSPPPVIALPGLGAMSSPPPLPASPASGKIPDFAKPPTEDKYFKQLKRF